MPEREPLSTWLQKVITAIEELRSENNGNGGNGKESTNVVDFGKYAARRARDAGLGVALAVLGGLAWLAARPREVAIAAAGFAVGVVAAGAAIILLTPDEPPDYVTLPPEPTGPTEPTMSPAPTTTAPPSPTPSPTPSPSDPTTDVPVPPANGELAGEQPTTDTLTAPSTGGDPGDGGTSGGPADETPPGNGGPGDDAPPPGDGGGTPPPDNGDEPPSEPPSGRDCTVRVDVSPVLDVCALEGGVT